MKMLSKRLEEDLASSAKKESDLVKANKQANDDIKKKDVRVWKPILQIFEPHPKSSTMDPPHLKPMNIQTFLILSPYNYLQSPIQSSASTAL